jgi:hypothetical protein
VALSFHEVLVAILKLHTESPLGNVLTSGSLPRLPSNITLLTDGIFSPISILLLN